MKTGLFVRTAGALLLAAVAIAPVGAGARNAAAQADKLTLEQQVGQLVLLRFVGTTAPEYVLEALRERRAAGAILFHENVTTPAQLRALTAELRAAGGRPIVAVDQEGRDIRILRWAPPFASQAQQAAAGTVRSSATRGARALRAAGITVSLAPRRRRPERAPRRPRRAGVFAKSGRGQPCDGIGGGGLEGRWRSVDGEALSRSGRRTAQHGPLPGDDHAVAREAGGDRSAPFEAAIRAGVPLVMVGHARYPALDRRRIASQSRTIVEGLLRNGLGFRGVVVTDSMEAKASLATGGIGTVSERAVRAGADLVLLTGRGSYAPVYRHLLTMARRSASFRARVRESAARVLALKERGAKPPR